MIITDKFVMINYPKTGTTFFRKVIKDIHYNKLTLAQRLRYQLRLAQPPMRELMLLKWHGDYHRFRNFRFLISQHRVYRQIPSADRDKVIVSIIRNPLVRYVSSYVFGHWKHSPPLSLTIAKREFPDFPELSFLDFYKLLNHPLVNEKILAVTGADKLGNYTRKFLEFYARDPEYAVRRVLGGEPIETILPAITFLHQEFLEYEIENFLQEMGYPASDIQRVRSVGKQNVGSNKKKDTIKAAELVAVAKRVCIDDKAILEAFPEYTPHIQSVADGGELSKAPSSECIGPRQVGC